jgi:hypothetical protein
MLAKHNREYELNNRSHLSNITSCSYVPGPAPEKQAKHSGRVKHLIIIDALEKMPDIHPMW